MVSMFRLEREAIDIIEQIYHELFDQPNLLTPYK